MNGPLDGIMLSGERRDYVRGLLDRDVDKMCNQLSMMIISARTFNNLLEASEYATTIAHRIKEVHDNWRTLDRGVHQD